MDVFEFAIEQHRYVGEPIQPDSFNNVDKWVIVYLCL